MDQILIPSEILAAFGAVKNAFSTFYDRRDIANDNRDDIRRLLLLYQRLKDTMQHLQQSLSAFEQVSQKLIQVHLQTVKDNEQTLQTLQDDVLNAKITNRIKRMQKVLEECETDSKDIMEFLSTQVAPVLRKLVQQSAHTEYVADNNVPPNPPRLTLDYSTTCTCEGQLKEAVMNEGGRRVVGVVAIGMGGVGKTCALRGLADDCDIQLRFPGGVLYIQLGNDAKLSTIIQGIAKLVESTGNPPLAVQVSEQESLQKATEKASLWFRRHTCLFLIDDIWVAHGINSSVLSILTRLLGERSRLVYTTRDKQFMNACEKVIEFSTKERQGEMAREMLMTHAGFDWKETLSERNEEAVRGILEVCGGLPLALGVVGQTVRKESRGRLDEKENTWSHVYDQIRLKTESIADGDVEAYGALRLVVDTSLEVLQCENSNIRFDALFRALCVVEKQQRVPIEMLRNLWGAQDLGTAAYVVERLDEVNLVRRLLDGSMVLIQLHDVILDIAIRKASERYEVRKCWKSLVDNYIAEESQSWEEAGLKEKSEDEVVASCQREKTGRVGWYRKLCCLNVNGVTTDKVVDEKAVKQGGVHEQLDNEREVWAWWNTKNDGYIHDNVCRALRGAGYEKQLLWLVSKPQWIVNRLQNNGIFAVEQDVDIAKAVARSMRDNDESICKHLEMVRKAVRMSCMRVSNNRQEAWFQIHGRLLWYATQCERTRRFVKEIEEFAPRPWARASIGFLEQAGTAVAEVIRCTGSPLSLRVDKGRVSFFFEEGEGRFVLSQYCFSTGETELQTCDLTELWGSNSRWVECEISRHLKIVVMLVDGKKAVWWNSETSEKGIWFCSGISCSALSPDGNLIVCGSDKGTLQVRKVKSGELVGEQLASHRQWISCVAWSGDGKHVVSGSSDDTMRVWEVESGKPVGEPCVGHTRLLSCVAWSVDGRRVVSGSHDGMVQVWEMGSRKATGVQLVGNTSWVRCVAWSEDGKRVVSGLDDGTVWVWDVESEKPVGEPLAGHTEQVTCVAWSEDGERVVSGSLDYTVRIWEVGSGESAEKPLVSNDGLIECVAWSEESVDTPLVNDEGLIECVAWSRDGRRVVCGSDDRAVGVWDVESGERVGEPMVGHSEAVTCVAWSEDGRRVVSGSWDTTLRVWEIGSGEFMGEWLVDDSESVPCVPWSARRGVSGSEDRTMQLWEVESVEPVGEPLIGHTREVICVAWSRDGRKIVSGSEDKTIRVWQVESEEPIREPLVGHTRAVTCVAWNADGRRVVSGSEDKTVRVWDVESEEQVGKALVGHTGCVRCVAWSADGRRVVSGSEDKTVRVWEVESGEPVGEPLVGHTGYVVCVAFSGDGMRMVSLSVDGTGRVWEVGRGRAIRGSIPVTGFPVGLNNDGSKVLFYGECEERRALDVASGHYVQVADHEFSTPAPGDMFARWSHELRFGSGRGDVLGTGDTEVVRVGNWWLSDHGFVCKAEL